MKKGITKQMSKKWIENWAEEVLNSEEGLEAKEQFNKDFLHHVIYGEISVGSAPENNLVVSLTASEIIEKFSNYLSEEQIEELKKYE